MPSDLLNVPDRPPKLRLYVVHGSHPCAAVEKAMQLKALDYSIWEWPPPLHTVGQKLLTGARTVPSLRIGREMVSGSRRIMRRLDDLAPEPRLYPLDLDRRVAIEEADRWGDEMFQPVARQLIWTGLRRHPQALASYGRNSRLRLPAPVLRLIAPGVVRAQAQINRARPEAARQCLRNLPAQLTRIDAWFADGTLRGVDNPTAADLQILATIRLLSTIGDVRPLLRGRSSLVAAVALWPEVDGELPAGAISGDRSQPLDY